MLQCQCTAFQAGPHLDWRLRLLLSICLIHMVMYINIHSLTWDFELITYIAM